MDAETANKFYERNKKYFYDKITLLDLALAALDDAAGEAYDEGYLQGAYVKLEDFQERQAALIFEEIMNMGSFQIEEITRP